MILVIVLRILIFSTMNCAWVPSGTYVGYNQAPEPLTFWPLSHLDHVAYPELVSRGVSKTRTFKWLVKVGASIYQTPDLKKMLAGGGVSGQPKNHPGYATVPNRRPPLRCADRVTKDTQLSMSDALITTHDRPSWRSLVRDATCPATQVT